MMLFINLFIMKEYLFQNTFSIFYNIAEKAVEHESDDDTNSSWYPRNVL